MFLFVVREEGLQETHVWDPHTQRKRRKVVFAGEADEDDLNSSSDDDDCDVSEYSDDDEQEEDEDEDNLSSFLKEARARSDKTDSPPPIKKQKVEDRKEEMPAFADSEDELEMSEEEGGVWRAGDSGHCSEEEDSDAEEEKEDDEEVEDDETDEEEEEKGKYRTQFLF